MESEEDLGEEDDFSNLDSDMPKKAGDDIDSSAENGVEDNDNDLSEDPLDKVNSDNILPSQTRQRIVQPMS